ncbi:MAG: lipopolysaccharide export system chaperone component LptA [Roseibaca calidilacus]|uniref:Lipopolysaccharide export system chaperone component LptA n=2 Tax=Roseibaca calidilacus TaxID=1666912 RepID=A0A0N8K8X1_9RHOB|nr:MAG: lipopolysaccharide export system chaperone component LptA [Roseibaca calidilacus]CUX81821.1 lipopolysaccharide export system protein LptA [Roseibaca calidilacus]
MRTLAHITLVAAFMTSLAPMAVAQGTSLSFEGLNAVRGKPVEVRSDKLTVDNSSGTTTFSGNAVLGQGDMRLAAQTITVVYIRGDDTRISRLEASGGVTLVTAVEAAEALEAVYDIDAGTVRMTGSVILTQGPNVLSGDRLTVNLRSGQGQLDGRVRTIIQTDR